MKQKNVIQIICSIIAAVAVVAGSFFSGTEHGIKQQNRYIQSHAIDVTGDNNTVSVNNIDDLINQCNKLVSENETLKKQNTQYFNDYTEQKDTNSTLETKLNDVPDLSFSSVGLCIDGNQIPINSDDSIVDINGRQYWSKEIVTNILPNTQTVNIKDNILYIGQMIANPTNLFDQFINYNNDFQLNNIAYTDTYGNSHSNCAVGSSSNGSITFVLNNKYSKLKIGAAINSSSSDYSCDSSFQIKADDTIVYSSDTINVKTKPFIVDNISINDCSLLTIEYSSEHTSSLILYDAVLYN